MERKNGELIVHPGPMFSGKSEELIRRLRLAAVRTPGRVVGITPEGDTRPAFNNPEVPGPAPVIDSRSGSEFPAEIAKSIGQVLTDDLIEKHDVFGIDEGHFYELEDLMVGIHKLLVAKKTVHVSYIDLAANGTTQPIAAEIISAGIDEYDDHFAYCLVENGEGEKCGEKAHFSRLYKKDGPPFSREGMGLVIVDVGEVEFKALCRFHFDKEDKNPELLKLPGV